MSRCWRGMLCKCLSNPGTRVTRVTCHASRSRHQQISQIELRSQSKYTIRSIVCEASCHPIIQSLGHSVTRSLSHLVTVSLGHWVIRSLGHSVSWSLGLLVTCSLVHLVTRSLGHLVTQSLCYSVILFQQCYLHNTTN